MKLMLVDNTNKEFAKRFYTVLAFCDSCGWKDKLKIAKGLTVHGMDCPKCECACLRPQPEVMLVSK